MIRFCVVISLSIVYLFDVIVCPPVTELPKTTSELLDDKVEKDEKLGLEYERYLKEVVAILESDENFRKKLEESNISDIKISRLSYEKYLREVMTVLMSDNEFVKKMVAEGRNVTNKSGEIAKHLDFVGHGIRTRLDEIKRKEIDRLRQVMRLRGFLQKGLKANYPGIALQELDKEKILGHLDHSNPNTFEVSDLAKLIKQATQDLEDVDKKRKEEFKRYEMEKEVLRREQLKGLDDVHRQEEEKKQEEMQKKHDDHPKLHHPGNEEQLKEVWEESDGLNKKDFDPKTFFHLHDTNGDGFLDLAEVEALFQQELDKVYDPNAPEDDMMERYEEMNRMREHFVKEVDKNTDQLISLQEFLDSTQSDGYKKEEGWEPIDKEDVYSEEELAEFQKNYEEQLKLEHEQREGRLHEQQQQEVGGERHEQPQRMRNEEHQQIPDQVPGQAVQQPVEQHVVQQQHVQQPIIDHEPQHVQQPVIHQEPEQQINSQNQNDAQAVHFVPQQQVQQQPNNDAQIAQHQEQPVVAFQQQQPQAVEELQQPGVVPPQPQGHVEG